tara:strand:+ start:203 stop:409 length:207 start_codon:yes stop_codon:yes gene_type:complete
MCQDKFAPDRWEFWRELPDPDDELHNGEKFIEDTEHLYDCLDEHDDDDEDDESEGNIETEEQGWRRSQ